jgi:hypothetical protein
MAKGSALKRHAAYKRLRYFINLYNKLRRYLG